MLGEAISIDFIIVEIVTIDKNKKSKIKKSNK